MDDKTERVVIKVSKADAEFVYALIDALNHNAHKSSDDEIIEMLEQVDIVVE